jgi:hypothetical protein
MAYENGAEVFNDRLKSLTTRHKDCRTEMHGTGRMIYYAPTDRWFIEYYCPDQNELHEIYTPETNAIALRIAAGSAS